MRSAASQPERERGRYPISVAAELVGTGVQNLRVYERKGLLEPARTPGGTRLYSEADVDRLRRIGDLLAGGLNLAGVERVLALEDAVQALEGRVDGLQQHNSMLRADNRTLREAMLAAGIDPDATKPPRTGAGRRRRGAASS